MGGSACPARACASAARRRSANTARTLLDGLAALFPRSTSRLHASRIHRLNDTPSRAAAFTHTARSPGGTRRFISGALGIPEA
jgi:hypothetical protein